jgi:hypothetical protein
MQEELVRKQTGWYVHRLGIRLHVASEDTKQTADASRLLADFAPDRPRAYGTSAKKKTSGPEDKLRLYERLVDSVAGPETKSNFGAGYTAVNGNMYSMISKHGWSEFDSPSPSAPPSSGASRGFQS